MMINIDLPEVNDFEELQYLAYCEFKNGDDIINKEYSKIYDCYSDYKQNNGNPWKVNISNNISNKCKTVLKSRYTYQPKDSLPFIKKLRKEVSPDVCPMCGSYSTGTLDHYLPKDQFKEFSVLSSNLIPACQCNSFRGERYKGVSTGERPIHPYFDNFINNLLYITELKGSFETPNINLIVKANDPRLKPVLSYHLENVILRTNTINWMEKQWGKLLNRGYKILKSYLDIGTVDQAVLSSALRDLIKDLNAEYNTRNHWKSFFYEGLLVDKSRIKKMASLIEDQKNGNII